MRTEYSALLYHVVVPKLRLTPDTSQASVFTVRIDCCDMTRKEFRTQQELYAKHQLRRIERHVRANDKRLYACCELKRIKRIDRWCEVAPLPWRLGTPSEVPIFGKSNSNGSS